MDANVTTFVEEAIKKLGETLVIQIGVMEKKIGNLKSEVITDLNIRLTTTGKICR